MYSLIPPLVYVGSGAQLLYSCSMKVSGRNHRLISRDRHSGDTVACGVLCTETPDVEKLRAAMHGSGSLAGGTLSSLQFGRRRNPGMSASDGTAASKDSFDSRGAAAGGYASPPCVPACAVRNKALQPTEPHDESTCVVCRCMGPSRYEFGCAIFSIASTRGKCNKPCISVHSGAEYR